jgi:hypothetical protein
MKNIPSIALTLVALALLLAQTGRGFAEYPDKPIRLLPPFPAGGVDQPAAIAVLRILDSGRVCLKRSGPMRCTVENLP